MRVGHARVEGDRLPEDCEGVVELPALLEGNPEDVVAGGRIGLDPQRFARRLLGGVEIAGSRQGLGVVLQAVPREDL